MKNKKLIAITVCLVAAVLVGMLGLSKFFETSWQSENTIDNSLNAEIVDSSESLYNYPYISPEEAMAKGSQIMFSDILFYDAQDIVLSEEIGISCQEAVNKVGEDIKYLTGFKNHTKQPVAAKMVYRERSGDNEYAIRTAFFPENVGEDHVIAFDVWLGANTGKYHSIKLSYDFWQPNSNNDIGKEDIIIDDSKKNEIITFIKEMLSVLKIEYKNDIFNCNISGLKFKNMGVDNIGQYTVSFALIDNENVINLFFVILCEPDEKEIYYPKDIYITYEERWDI